MHITFQTAPGDAGLSIRFFWQLTLEAAAPGPDIFIPELFFDFLLVQQGEVCVTSQDGGTAVPLPNQSLRTLHTDAQILTYTPLVTLFGARFELNLVERLSSKALPANRWLPVGWLETAPTDLPHFVNQLTQSMPRRLEGPAPPLLDVTLNQTDHLISFSPRHRRRLVRERYGLSQKALQGIDILHVFLANTCDFSSGNPRIIEYIDADVYTDQPHLNRMFKKKTGLSPLAFFEAQSILQDNLMAASYNAA